MGTNYTSLSSEEQLLAQIVALYCLQHNYRLDVMARVWEFKEVTSNNRSASVVIVNDGHSIRTYTVEYVEGQYERYFRVKGSHQHDTWRTVSMSDIFNKEK